MSSEYVEYRVKLFKDKATGLLVAEVPALGIADDGMDTSEALENLHQMVSFHLECLLEEGEIVPRERSKGEGIFFRVKLPARAA